MLYIQNTKHPLHPYNMITFRNASTNQLIADFMTIVPGKLEENIIKPQVRQAQVFQSAVGKMIGAIESFITDVDVQTRLFAGSMQASTKRSSTIRGSVFLAGTT